MENVVKGLTMAAAVIMTCIIIGIGFFILRESKSTTSNSIGQINKLNSEFGESDKTVYDGIHVTGSEVINAINKFKGESIGIIVNTKKTQNTMYINKLTGSGTQYELGASVTTSVTDAQDVNNATYINPNGRFLGEVLYNSNNAIVGIKFTQS